MDDQDLISKIDNMKKTINEIRINTEYVKRHIVHKKWRNNLMLFFYIMILMFIMFFAIIQRDTADKLEKLIERYGTIFAYQVMASKDSGDENYG